MRKRIAYPFLAIGCVLFCWINLPKSGFDWLRSKAASFVTYFSITPSYDTHELNRLRLENQRLRAQIDYVRTWLDGEQYIEKQAQLQAQLVKKASEKAAPSFFQRRAEHLRTLLLEQLFALPAQVIYRDPSAWSSSLWVRVGEEDNRAVGYTVVAKNSPVVSEGAVVGVIDFVGGKQSRVRLITDSGLSPSVRAVRATSGEDGYLAKGELHGSSAPFWRSRSPVLKGVGFNYDYPDEEGRARELNGDVPLLKEGDALLTSGLDGVFPQGLSVGVVSWVAPLKPGSYAYDIEVRPAASNLNDLQTVFVLPPVGE